MDKEHVSIPQKIRASLRAHAVALVGASLITAADVAAAAPAAAVMRQAEDVLPVLRVQVDARRGRAWVLKADALYVYDALTRRLVKRIELPGWLLIDDTFSCAPDLAIAPTGAALVTSNAVPVLWQIDFQTLSVRQHWLKLDADQTKDIGFTGLAFGRGGRDLFGVSSSQRSAWRIDLQAAGAHKLPLWTPVLGAFGEKPRSTWPPDSRGDLKSVRFGDSSALGCLATPFSPSGER
jgi:hypothetical protein